MIAKWHQTTNYVKWKRIERNQMNKKLSSQANDKIEIISRYSKLQSVAKILI